MATLEEFFDLRIATVRPGEEPPPEVHWVRIEEPPRRVVAELSAQGWYYKPCYVTYVLLLPRSLEDYIAQSFRSGTRNKPRKLLREVPRRYRLAVDEELGALDAFRDLYRRTIVSRERGKDRLGEHAEEEFGPGWTGFYLYDGATLVAGVLTHELRGHLSVAYGAFDPAHQELDLEHFLIMQAMDRSIRRKFRMMSLGMDTNRYGHHLSLRLPAYKLRIGFTPLPHEPAGRELVRIRDFDLFREGLFFYGYSGGSLVGHLFTRGEPDLRPYRHHVAPPLEVHRIGEGNGP